MDLAQAFLLVAGWIFFAAWGLVLATVSIIAFGRDLLPSARRDAGEQSVRGPIAS